MILARMGIYLTPVTTTRCGRDGLLAHNLRPRFAALGPQLLVGADGIREGQFSTLLDGNGAAGPCRAPPAHPYGADRTSPGGDPQFVDAT